MQEARMMLKAELYAFPELEVAASAVQPPDDFAICTVDLMNTASIPSGNHVIAIGILVNTIDMKIVPGVRTIVARPCLTWVDGKDTFGRGDMV